MNKGSTIITILFLGVLTIKKEDETGFRISHIQNEDKN